MPFRPSLHRQRHLCGVMLLVWLFAVLSSTVNACVLTEKVVPAHAGHSAHVAVALHDHGHDHPGVQEGGLNHLDEHLACHKFCKDQSAPLTPFKSAQDQDFHPVLIALVSTFLPDAWTPPSMAPTSPRPPAHGPPVHIRFLRLTL